MLVGHDGHLHVVGHLLRHYVLSSWRCRVDELCVRIVHRQGGRERRGIVLEPVQKRRGWLAILIDLATLPHAFFEAILIMLLHLSQHQRFLLPY